MSNPSDIGVVLNRLFDTIEGRKDADEKTSYTAQLLHAGAARCAQKFGEEAVEAAIAGAMGDKKALTEEAADVLYHLLVLLSVSGLSLEDIASGLASREGVSGHEEKAAR